MIPNIEFFPLDELVPGFSPTPAPPDVITWGPRDYGARVGIYRVMDVLSRFGVRGTVALNSDVCDAYPEIVEDAMALDWEFMGHNESNARRFDHMEPDEERESILRTFVRIEESTGSAPRGWLSASLQESWHTLDFLVEAGATYVADWTNDDQPYLIDVSGGQLVSIPYTQEINDLPQFLRRNRTADEFEVMMRRQFDTLYEEGADSARVMAIAIHPYIIGVPHRIGALAAGLEYICAHEDVWLATGSEIIDAYLESDATF